MSNLATLRTPDSETARAMQKKGAEARKRNAKERKRLIASVQALLSEPLPNSTMTGAEALAVSLYKKAIGGNINAARLLFEMSGEKVEKVELNDKRENVPQGLTEIYKLLKENESDISGTAKTP